MDISFRSDVKTGEVLRSERSPANAFVDVIKQEYIFVVTLTKLIYSLWRLAEGESLLCALLF